MARIVSDRLLEGVDGLPGLLLGRVLQEEPAFKVGLTDARIDGAGSRPPLARAALPPSFLWQCLRRPVPGSFAIPCLKGMPGEPPVPLFVCHANCCRSVMADYLYRHLTGTAAHSAGVEVGEQINDRAAAMLSCWGVDARGHRPRRLDRALCDEAGVILAMGPLYLARLLLRFGRDLASKSYLFADPFVVPPGFEEEAFLVYDPSFDMRAPEELVREFEWFRRRVTEVHGALVSGRPAMVPASRYLDRLDALALD